MGLKVLNIVSGGLRNEGITLTQYTYLKALTENNLYNEIIVDLVEIEGLSHDNVADKFRKLGIKVYLLPNRKKRPLQYFIKLKKLLKKGHYDVVHAHGSSALLAIEMLAAKMAKVPVRIVHSRNTKCDQKILDKVLRPIFYRLYTNAFACGKEAGEWLFGKRDFFVLYNGKDFSLFHFSAKKRTEVRKRLELEDKLVIGHVGNFNAQKNHKFLLKMFAILHSQIDNTVLYLMGDGKMKDELIDTAKQLKIEQSVVFAGRVEDVADRLQAMDIMVLPSLYEGLPNVVLEWQAVGVPCLISDTITKECAVTDLIEYKSLDEGEKAWSDEIIKMIQLLSNREEEAKKATMALQEAGFDINENVVTLVEQYKELVDKQRRRG